MASGRPIDHVVLAVQDLDRAAVIYQDLGFTLTPRAAHEDRMGTSNWLAQFSRISSSCSKSIAQKNWPDTTSRRRRRSSASATTIDTPCWNARAFPCLAFASDDARVDIRGFSAAGLPTFAPFDFERYAKLPDGSKVTVAFSLAFVQSREMLNVAFFASENQARNHFWKPEYQSHPNDAAGIVAAYLSSPAPERDAAFVSKMFGGKVSPVPGGCNVACGPSQELRILTPQAMAERVGSGGVDG